MRRFAVSRCLCILSLASLIVFGNSKLVITLGQSSSCAENTCSYLPLVIRPVPIIVVSTSLYGTSVGKNVRLLIAGEIRNKINVTFGDVILRARIYSNGQLIQEVQQKAIIPETLPGQLNIYRFDTGVFGALNPANFPTTVDVLTTTVDTSERYRNLQIESVTTSRLVLVGQDIPGTTVTVTVRNNYAQALHNVQIHVWSFITDLSKDNFIVCTFGNCSGNSVVSVMSPGQVYTTTLNWRDISTGNAVVPPSAINVVAQGTISP